MSASPLYVHDCDRCTYLGPYAENEGDPVVDLYFCDQGNTFDTVIARHSDDGPDYLSGWGMRIPQLVEAQRRAVARGFGPELQGDPKP